MSSLGKKAEALALEQLKEAARQYAASATESGDLRVLMDGARLRIAAKKWAEAERDVQQALTARGG